MINLAFTVPIHLLSSFGRTLIAKFAQCGQVSEAYSIIVIGASGLPRMRSSGCTASAFVEPVFLAGPCAEVGNAPPMAKIISSHNDVFRMKTALDSECPV